MSTQLVFTNLILAIADLARWRPGTVLMGTSLFGPSFVGILCMLILPYFFAKAGYAANDLRIPNLYKPPQSRLGKPQSFQITHLTVFFDGFSFFIQSLQLQSSKVSIKQLKYSLTFEVLPASLIRIGNHHQSINQSIKHLNGRSKLCKYYLPK